MKKLLGISLVAVLAATPLMAMAGEDVAPSSTLLNNGAEAGLAEDATGVIYADAPYYKGKTITDADKASAASAAYVKGAYNDAISAVNKVAKDLTTDLTLSEGNGIDITSNTVSVQAKTNGGITVDSNGVSVDVDGSTIEVDATNGVQIANSGVTTEKLANEAVTLAKIEADDMQQGTDTYASSTKLTSKGYVDQQIAGINTSITNNLATKNGVDYTIEHSTITADVASQSVTGSVPMMVDWGATTAQTAAVTGSTAGGTISNVSITTTYSEPNT